MQARPRWQNELLHPVQLLLGRAYDQAAAACATRLHTLGIDCLAWPCIVGRRAPPPLERECCACILVPWRTFQSRLPPTSYLLQEAPDVGTYAEANGTCVSCKTAHCKECTNVNATNPTSTCVRCEMGM